jgi:hypothetical protein
MSNDQARRVFAAAMAAEESGQIAKALRLWEKASRLAKDVPAPRLGWAGLLYDQCRYKEAIKVARGIIRRWPRRARYVWPIQ